MTLLKTTLMLSILISIITSCERGEKFIIQGKYCYYEEQEELEGEDYEYSQGEENIEIGLYKMTKPNPTQLDLYSKRAFKLIDSQKVSDKGEFKFTGKVDPNEPQIYFVGMFRPEGLFFSGSYESDVQMFVAEPGEISMKIYYDRSEVTGTPINEKLSEIFYRDFDAIIRQYKDSIRALDPNRYYHITNEAFGSVYTDTSSEIDNYPETIAFKEKQEELKKQRKDEFYLFLKKYADKRFSNFFVHLARSSYTDEQLEELTQIGGGVLNFEEEDE